MDLQEIPENKLIVQSNAITESRFEYSRAQMDLLFMIMAQLGKEDVPAQVYSLYLKDIENITKRKWNYTQLDDSISVMGDRHFHIQKPKSLDWKKIWLFQSVEYKEGEGRVDVKLSDDARGHLFGLKGNFTVFQLASALALGSSYSKRIYTICCRWKDDPRLTFKGYILLPIDELKYMLGIKKEGESKEKYKQIGELKKWVLDVAKEQIDKETDMHFDYELIKKQSRSYTHIKMFISPQERKQLEIDFNDKKGMEKQRRMGVIEDTYGLDSKSAEKLSSDVNWKIFEEAVAITSKALSTKKVKQEPKDYLVGILKKKVANFKI
jgi:plasmid replication initiation protein